MSRNQKNRSSIYIEGERVAFVEVEEKYFPYIIKWRNDPENNAFLNQTTRLTMDSQRDWYETYKNDDTQGLLIMLDKMRGNIPFGTNGWTDYDPVERVCITGRLLVGDMRYRGSVEFIEAMLLYTDYIYDEMGVDLCYGHIAKANIASMRFNKHIGFHSSAGYPTYEFRNVPHVDGLRLVEVVRSRADWQQVRGTLVQMIDAYGRRTK